MDQDNKLSRVNEVAVQQLMVEIKILEKKIQEGNYYKKRNGLLACAAGIAVVGGVCAVGAPQYALPVAGEALMQYSPTLAGVLMGEFGVGLGVVGGAGGVLGGLLGGLGGFISTNGQLENQQKMGERLKVLLKAKLISLKESANQQKINFIFNEDSPLYPAYARKTEEQVKEDISVRKGKTAILLLKERQVSRPLSPFNIVDYRDALEEIFMTFFEREVDKRPIVEIIDISNAEMHDAQLDDLLEFGLGCCGTTILNLNKNRLTFNAVRILKNFIKGRKEAFQEVKSLDLSDNNLTEDCLPDLKEIVNYLGIEELNISGNRLNGIKGEPNYFSSNFTDFLSSQPKVMPTLKVLKIANTNLTDRFLEPLNDMLSTPSILKHLDLANNSHLGRKMLRELFEQGYARNQSIQTLAVDQQSFLRVEKLIAAREEKYTKMYQETNQVSNSNEPRFLYLLNRYCQKKYLNINMHECFSPLLYEQLENCADKIEKIRENIFKSPQNLFIPITEIEFVKLMGEELPAFYLDVIKRKDLTVLDKRLFSDPEQDSIAYVQAMHVSLFTLTQERKKEAKLMTVENRVQFSIKKSI